MRKQVATPAATAAWPWRPSHEHHPRPHRRKDDPMTRTEAITHAVGTWFTAWVLLLTWAGVN